MSPDTVYHTDWWVVSYFVAVNLLAVYGIVQLIVHYGSRWFDHTVNYHIHEAKWIRESAERIRKEVDKKHTPRSWVEDDTKRRKRGGT